MTGKIEIAAPSGLRILPSSRRTKAAGELARVERWTASKTGEVDAHLDGSAVDNAALHRELLGKGESCRPRRPSRRWREEGLLHLAGFSEDEANAEGADGLVVVGGAAGRGPSGVKVGDHGLSGSGVIGGRRWGRVAGRPTRAGLGRMIAGVDGVSAPGMSTPEQATPGFGRFRAGAGAGDEVS